MLVAVIPTLVLAGPLALLAALCPAVFAGLALWWRRWAVLLAVASLDSTLYVAHAWLRGYLVGTWWGGERALWVVMAAVCGLGAVVAFRRRWQAFLITALGLGCAVIATQAGPRPEPQVVWLFEAVERGLIASSPCVAGDRVYVGAAHVTARGPRGAVYCLDRATGRQVWAFDRGGTMKQVLSSPTVVDGKLYIGEGFHEDADCRLYCLDAATGHEVWSFATASHTEASPRVAAGRVVFGAGDDGVYALDAATGARRWHFTGLHVDTTLAVADDHLFGGSGNGRAEAFCLDATTGTPVWRTPLVLDVFGSPRVVAGRVYLGLGNGKLTRAAPKPAGAVVCLDATSGKIVWRRDVPDAVLGDAVVDGERVTFGCRGGTCSCLDARDGSVLWTRDVGSPVVATPVLADGLLSVVGSGGLLWILDPRDGRVVWQLDLAKQSQTRPELLSTPTVDQGHLYFGAGLRYSLSCAAVAYCVRLPGEATP